jgi:hypothetical protein
MKPTSLLRSILLGAAAAVLLSCSTPAPLGVDARGPAALGIGLDPLLQPIGLLKCAPLPADTTVQTFGPGGGVLYVGPHIFFVPPGALVDTVTITAIAPSDTVNRVHFQPDGLMFQQPAQLLISYANCNLLGSILPKRIALVSSSLLILDYLPSLDDFASRTVRGQVQHFSDYALAW